MSKHKYMMEYSIKYRLIAKEFFTLFCITLFCISAASLFSCMYLYTVGKKNQSLKKDDLSDTLYSNKI